MCKWRNNSGEWDSLTIAGSACHPCISASDDGIHIVWEQHYVNSAQGQIKHICNDGLGWSRIQTISTISGRNCYPYIASGAVTVWADMYQGQWDIFASQKTDYGTWTLPQNISQTPNDSKYPQAAIKQTATDTNVIYMWTEGNELPYEVKIHSTSDKYSIEKKLSNVHIVLSNPIRDILNIKYNSKSNEMVIAKLYDTTGRFVDTIFDSEIKVGCSEFAYNCNHLSCGVYFIKFESNKQIITEKVIIHR